jgi:hypothetical protein
LAHRSLGILHSKIVSFGSRYYLMHIMSKRYGS